MLTSSSPAVGSTLSPRGTEPVKNADTQKYRPRGHPNVNKGKTGVLLMNLGTPEATSYWPMRRYLKEFLSDRRVIEVNRALWWLILNGIILTFRPQKSGKAYEKIWNRARNESPYRREDCGKVMRSVAL